MRNCSDLQNHSSLSQTLIRERKLAQQQESGMAPGDASSELVRRSVAMILAQTRAGGGTSLAMGGILGFMFVPAVGWPAYLAWYVILAGGMLWRQPYLRRLVEREGANERTLRKVAMVAAV